MNRRNFLRSAVGVAVATALGRSFIEPVEAAAPVDPRIQRLTDATAWYIKNPPEGSFYWHEERRRSFHLKKPIEGDFTTENLRYRYRAHERYSGPRPCDCTVMDWLPDYAARDPCRNWVPCANCGGVITDERLEDFDQEREHMQSLLDRDVAIRRAHLTQTPLTEESLNELLRKIRAEHPRRPLTITPRFVVVYGSSGW